MMIMLIVKLRLNAEYGSRFSSLVHDGVASGRGNGRAGREPAARAARAPRGSCRPRPAPPVPRPASLDRCAVVRLAATLGALAVCLVPAGGAQAGAAQRCRTSGLVGSVSHKPGGG